MEDIMEAPNQSESEQFADLTADCCSYENFWLQQPFCASPGVLRQAFALHSGRGLLKNINKTNRKLRKLHSYMAECV
jgi:hypothetical protein